MTISNTISLPAALRKERRKPEEWATTQTNDDPRGDISMRVTKRQSADTTIGLSAASIQNPPPQATEAPNDELASIGHSESTPLPSLGWTHSTTVVVAAGLFGGVAWWASGRAVAVPVTLLGVIAALAAIVDARTTRLPNRASGGALLVVAASLPLVVAIDHQTISSAALAAGTGIVYSGAPLLFAIWLVRPHLIGGGDWKMLGALGAGLGLALPFAALVMTTVACLVQIVASTVRRTRIMPFGPSIAIGYATAVLLLPLFVPILGGPYS